MYSKIEDLHEELFHFLSFFSHAQKEKGEGFAFLLRPEVDEAFQKGRWFYDNLEEGIVFLYFTESTGYIKHQIQVSINMDGTWFVKLDYDTNIDPYFWDRLTIRLANILERGKETPPNSKEYDRKQVFLYPNTSNKDYREGLHKIIYTLYEFFNFEPIAKDYKEKIAFISIEKYKDFVYQIINKEKIINSAHFKSILIQNVHQIKNACIQNLPDTNWIFLTGENGFGKTSLLHAISIGLSFTGNHFIFQKKNNFIELTYSVKFSNKINTRVNNTQYTLFSRRIELLACYGASRLEMENQENQNNSTFNQYTIDNLLNANIPLKNIEYELLLSFHDNKAKYESIVEMLKTLIPTLHHIEIKDRQVLYYEKDITNNQEFEPVSFAQLASGMRSIIAMAGDIYLRLVNHKSTTNYHPQNAAGIVIIDELDLHLHPKWQRALPGLLSKVFPNVQFIASTHSPIPLLGAPKGAVFLKVNRTTEEGVTVERLEQLEKEIHHLLPNAILTSDIFGLDDINAVTNENLDEVSTADSYEDFKLEEELMKSLKIIKAQEGDIFKK